jgi:hypothetical protein
LIHSPLDMGCSQCDGLRIAHTHPSEQTTSERKFRKQNFGTAQTIASSPIPLLDPLPRRRSDGAGAGHHIPAARCSLLAGYPIPVARWCSPPSSPRSIPPPMPPSSASNRAAVRKP